MLERIRLTILGVRILDTGVVVGIFYVINFFSYKEGDKEFRQITIFILVIVILLLTDPLVLRHRGRELTEY